MKPRIVVAISGGSDSAISSYILKQQGFDVIGLHITMSDNNWCCSRKSAMLVAETLGIEYVTLDRRAEFFKNVITPFLNEYASGMTPNPCIFCNAEIKWKALIEVADKLGADLVATGHYARACNMPWGWSLMKPADKYKDQSYFLYNLPSEMLARTRFPLANLSKEFVREKIRELRIPSMEEESQETCFIPRNKLAEFLEKNIPHACKPGDIYDIWGKKVGEHKGIAFYTIGQREKLGGGFERPMYVAKIIPQNNTIIIADSNNILSKKISVKKLFLRRDFSRVFNCTVKIRYRGPESNAQVTIVDDDSAVVEFEEAQRAPAPGQSAVFYSGIEAIGGGIIATVDYRERM